MATRFSGKKQKKKFKINRLESENQLLRDREGDIINKARRIVNLLGVYAKEENWGKMEDKTLWLGPGTGPSEAQFLLKELEKENQ